MAWDRKVFRSSQDAVGAPGDSRAINATDDNTMVALLKGIYALLAGTITVTTPAGTSTEAKQDAGNATLVSIDGHVDGLETLVTSTNTKLDTLHTDLATTLGGYLDGVETSLTAINNNTDTLETLTGGMTETAPASDTASSGLNGRLQRIAQRITSLIALVPASLGQKAMTASFAVTVASDQTAYPISPGASAATGGIPSTARLLSAANSTNATSAKASAGRMYALHGYNAAAGVRYIKLYNKASAPTVGTDTPVKTLAIPPSCGFAFDWPHGYSFSTGIAYAFTTGSADADTGAVTAADILGFNLDYA